MRDRILAAVADGPLTTAYCMEATMRNDPCRSERGGEPDDPAGDPFRWIHCGFGAYEAKVLGVRVLVRVARVGRRGVAYVPSTGGWIGADVPFGDNRRAALAAAKAAAVAHVTAWGPPDPTDDLLTSAYLRAVGEP